MSTVSTQSNEIYSIQVSEINGFTSKFTYNFYVTDEYTQSNPTIPDVYKKPTINKNDINLSTFSLRTPRYVELNWTLNNFGTKKITSVDLQSNSWRAISQDNLAINNFMPYSFSSFKSIENASEDINRGIEGELLTNSALSQATITENFLAKLMEDYQESSEASNLEFFRKEIETSSKCIEKIGNKSYETLGITFFKEGEIRVPRLFQAIKDNEKKFYMILNNSVIPDIFSTAPLTKQNLDQINKFSKSQKQNDVSLKLHGDIGEITKELPDGVVSTIGYVIEKYLIENDSFIKENTFFINNPNTLSTIDVNIRYGATYVYAIRAFLQLEIAVKPQNSASYHKSIFYLVGNPALTRVTCEENVPPPPPTELSFVWDYRKKELYVNWQMPFNSQRDITQFQILRRGSIHEPFELLEQQCFDFSIVKNTTGEIIDGNNLDMSKENSSYVTYQSYPTFTFKDKDFLIDAENLKSSKYIYTIASIDAHGLISNYGTQIEVTFDFFKNELVKKVVCDPGSPRPYPNLYLRTDLFKDVIEVSGLSSQKLKIYFMPEYFKLISYKTGINKLITTNQDGSNGGYYKLQFINVQNQKSDYLKIKIDDPKLLTAKTEIEKIEEIMYLV